MCVFLWEHRNSSASNSARAHMRKGPSAVALKYVNISIMKYFRIVKFQPNSLTELAQNCWLNSLIRVLHSFHIWQTRGDSRSEEVDEDMDNLELSWHQDIQSIIGFQESVLPCALQEALYLKGCALFEGHQLLHHHSGDLFPYFFQCLWRPLYRCFQLPRYVKAQCLKIA